MQTRAALERVAFEFIEDMHDDGVVYAEARFAPCFHRARTDRRGHLGRSH